MQRKSYCFFNTNFIIGSKQNKMDFENKLKKIKYPSEFPNWRVSFFSSYKLKASDYRTFICYTGPFLLMDIIDVDFFKHFLVYATAIRLLSQENVTAVYIRHADVLLRYFVQTFVALYEEDNLNYNLHAHLHLATQVSLFGPLHKLSCFAFEGMLKMCKKKRAWHQRIWSAVS